MIDVSNKFRLAHTYNRLVESGKASHIMCINGDAALIPTLEPTCPDEPIFLCPLCQAKRKLGLDAWSQITNVVKEHYI